MGKDEPEAVPGNEPELEDESGVVFDDEPEDKSDDKSDDESDIEDNFKKTETTSFSDYKSELGASVEYGRNYIQDLSAYVLDLTPSFSEFLSQTCFASFGLYFLVMAEVSKEIAITIPESVKADEAWGHLDGALSLIKGLSQIMMPKDELMANTAKGVTSLLSGSQAIFLTAIGLGPYGLAALVGLNLVHSIYDTMKTVRRFCFHEYWTQDTVNRRKYLEYEIESLTSDIEKVKQKLHLTDDAWLIIRKEQRLDKLQIELNNINKLTISEYTSNKKTHASDEVQKQLAQELTSNLYNNVMLSCAFVGVVLLFVPGAQIPSAALCLVSILMFAYQRRQQIYNFGVFLGQAVGILEKNAESYHGVAISATDDPVPSSQSVNDHSVPSEPEERGTFNDTPILRNSGKPEESLFVADIVDEIFHNAMKKVDESEEDDDREGTNFNPSGG